MTNNVLVQTIEENSNGITKGSSKRIIAYLFAFAILFLSVYPVVTDKTIPLELIGLLITQLLLLLGISAYHATINPPSNVISTGNTPAAAKV